MAKTSLLLHAEDPNKGQRINHFSQTLVAVDEIFTRNYSFQHSNSKFLNNDFRLPGGSCFGRIQ